MRLNAIVNDLIQAKDYLTLDYFIKKYEVSKRTIQSDLSYLIQISSANGFRLNSRTKSGYILEIVDEKKFNSFFNSVSEDTIVMNKTQRMEVLSFYLVSNNSYVTMEQLAQISDISIASIKKEMVKVEYQLHDFDLILERRKHYGLKVLGSNVLKRELLYELMQRKNPFISQIKKEKLKDFKNVSSYLISLLEKENLSINYTELQQVISKLEVITYFSMIFPLKSYEDNFLTDTSIQRVALCIKEKIEVCYETKLDSECFEEMKEVIQNKVRTKSRDTIFTSHLEQDIDVFLIEVDEMYDTHFYKDESFKKLLINHVSLLLDRLSKKISYKNVLIKEICVKYPMIFNISIRFSEMLKEKYNVEVTQDEAGFIATHFAAHMERERQGNLNRFTNIAVVCSSGGGSAQLLKMQMDSLFRRPNIETFSFTQMDELEEFEPDLIFTILPLNREFNVPVIYIKELLDDSDLIEIRKVLEYDNCVSFSLTEVNDSFYSIFQKDFFAYCDETDYMNLITKMAKQIEQSGYGGNHYLEYVLERESFMNTIYLNGISIAHPIRLCANRNVVSVMVLKNPIVYQNKEVQIVFMVSLKKNDQYIHKRITEKLFQLMNNKNQVQRIIQHHTFEDFIMILKEMDGGMD